MSSPVGTLRWADNTQAQLTRTDQFAMAAEAVKAQFGLILGRFIKQKALPGKIDLDAIHVPDSAFARQAREAMETACSPALSRHNDRAYLWGSLLAQACGHRIDPELYYVAAMLHDLGLTDTHHGCTQAGCFTMDSIAAGESVLSATSKERADRIRESILLHINVSVSGADYGWEAHYLNAGTAFDVVGTRLSEIPAQVRHDVLVRFPRLDLKNELARAMDAEVKLRPQSRFALLAMMGLKRLIRIAPFDD